MLNTMLIIIEEEEYNECLPDPVTTMELQQYPRRLSNVDFSYMADVSMPLEVEGGLACQIAMPCNFMSTRQDLAWGLEPAQTDQLGLDTSSFHLWSFFVCRFSCFNSFRGFHSPFA
jgi:hypothetical protein